MTSPNRSADAATKPKKHHNRVLAIMIHLRRYESMGASQLARDLGVSKSTISHLVRGKSHPLYRTAMGVVKCLELELGLSLAPDEVFSADGIYPTVHVCALVGCRGCIPEIVFDRDNSRTRPFMQSIQRAGKWTGDTCEFDEPTNEGGG